MKKNLISLYWDRGKTDSGRKLFPGRLILMLCFLCFSSGVFGQQTKLSYRWQQEKLSDVLKTLEKADVYKFIFNYEDVVYPVTAIVKDKTVLEILDLILEDKPLVYSRDGIYLMIRPKTSTSVQKYVIKGQVTDEKNIPMPGVTIRLDNTTVGTASDNNGNFTLAVSKAKGNLNFSFIGFESQVVAYEVGKPVYVKLKETAASLDEVQVIAYGERTQKELISSVSSVKAEEMKELPSVSIASMLQGRLAGVEIINQSGAPGAGGQRVAVRGYNSLLVEGASDGQPLYVIDGVPMFSYTSETTGTNTLSDLDPAMIESVEVLKDAAAAAIYGSRAGNGVILITTKKGRSGQALFTANVSYSTSFLPETPVQLGGRAERMLRLAYMQNMRGAMYDPYTNTYRYPVSYENVYASEGGGMYDYFWGDGSSGGAGGSPMLQDSLSPYYNNQMNWYKYVFRRAKVINANIQASGGTEKVRYMIGAGYYKEDGIMLSSDYSRANLLINLAADPVRLLKMDAQVYLAYTDKSKNLHNGGGGGAIEGMTIDPVEQSTLLQGSGEFQEQFLAEINKNVIRNDNYRLMTSLRLKYQIYKGLTFSVSGAIDYSQFNTNQFSPSALDPYYNENLSIGQISRSLSWLNEELLTYQYATRTGHNFEFLLGLNANKEQGFDISGWGNGGPSDNIYYYSGPGGVVNRGDNSSQSWYSRTHYSSDFQEKTMLSYFGRIMYNYRQRYLMEFTFRRDGSSTFGENVRWANFPSLALGWNFRDESFMQWATWMDMGKLRLSWGMSGQIFDDPYMAYGLMGRNGAFMGNPGMSTYNAIAPDLTWEKSQQWNVGLDVSAWEYRLKLKADYYYKYTSSLIYDVPTFGDLFGISTYKRNACAISNSGIELELKADIFRETVVKWSTRLNISRNWNRLEKTFDGKDLQVDKNSVLKRPLNGLYVFDDQGYYQSEAEVPEYTNMEGYPEYPNEVTGSVSGLVGEKRITDLNGDGMIDDDDLYYAGSALPLVYGGWAHEISWKGFDLNILFNYSLGRQMINALAYKSALGIQGPVFRDLRKATYWEKSGDNTTFPRLGAEMTDYLLRSNIEKVNMLKLKQLTLGYTLPTKYAKKIHFGGIRVFVTGENIWNWNNYSGLDPEVVSLDYGIDNGKAYPLPEKWTIGLTLNF